MADCLKVLIYGDSLLLAGLRSSLGAYPNLDVSALSGPSMSDRALQALRPNVIIFEVGAVQPRFHYQLAESLPELQLVGIEASANKVVVWSGRQLTELSVDALVEKIGNKARL